MIDNNDPYASDEEEDLCPLCVEEMDLSDKNFKPCPCGYQICQFCYNNIISNPDLNHKCPACRRVYSKDTVEYKVLSPEELNALKLKQLEKQRKRKQREKDQRDAEQASKKHLAGMRVIQKNLVYVVGLNLPGTNDEIQALLRTDAYFGQYGKISKMVVNRKSPNPASSHAPPSLSVYVTFTRKEDALKCIQAVDGSISDGRALKAAHGTTKYCSSYLRGQNCPNPNCMFLHEPGEEAESYNRENMSNRRVHSDVRSAIHGLAPALNNTPTTPHATLVSSESQSNLYQMNSNANNNNANIINNNNNNNNGTTAAHFHKTIINEEDERESTNMLPSNVGWGRGSSSNLYSLNTHQSSAAAVPDSSLATAFPTLGESVQSQQSAVNEIKRREKKKEQENSGNADYLEDMLDGQTVLKNIAETLNCFDPSFIRFDDNRIDKAEFETYPKLFNFAPGKKSGDGAQDTKEISNSIVDNLLVKKATRHVMTIQSIQFILQLHQQAQAAQAPSAPADHQGPAAASSQQRPQQPLSAAAQQAYLLQQQQQQQQRLQRFQQQQQHQQSQQASSTPLTPAANLALLQAQEAAMLQNNNDHQQGSYAQPQANLFQQQQQNQQQPQASQAAVNMNVPGDAVAAPPPGLFSGVQLPGNTKNESLANNGARSELLNHLLGGKK